MARSTFKVLFYVNGSKEKDGIVPIIGRVTINGTMAQFSCKQSIPKTLWNAKGNRAKGKSVEARNINHALDNIKAQIIKHYQRVLDCEAYVTAELVRNAYQGIGEEFAVYYIKEIRKKNPGIGGSKLWYMYRKSFEGNHPLGRDRFADIVDKYGLKVRLMMRKPRTTDSTHGLSVFPNLINEYIPLSPDRLWVSDITYMTIWTDAEHYSFCYLSLILDAYSEEIVGWCVGETLDAVYPIKALEMALCRIADN